MVIDVWYHNSKEIRRAVELDSPLDANSEWLWTNVSYMCACSVWLCRLGLFWHFTQFVSSALGNWRHRIRSTDYEQQGNLGWAKQTAVDAPQLRTVWYHLRDTAGLKSSTGSSFTPISCAGNDWKKASSKLMVRWEQQLRCSWMNQIPAWHLLGVFNGAILVNVGFGASPCLQVTYK